MPRHSYSPEDRARALTLAESVGAAEASKRLGIRVETVRSWRSKARKDPEQYALDIEIGAALIEDQPTGAYSVQELERLQRHIGQVLDLALNRGKTLDAQRLTVGFGIISDKLAKLRAERPEVDLAEAQARAEALLDRIAAERPMMERAMTAAELVKRIGTLTADRRRLGGLLAEKRSVGPRTSTDIEVPLPPRQEFARLRRRVKSLEAERDRLAVELAAARAKPVQRALPAPAAVVELLDGIVVAADVVVDIESAVVVAEPRPFRTARPRRDFGWHGARRGLNDADMAIVPPVKED